MQNPTQPGPFFNIFLSVQPHGIYRLQIMLRHSLLLVRNYIICSMHLACSRVEWLMDVILRLALFSTNCNICLGYYIKFFMWNQNLIMAA